MSHGAAATSRRARRTDRPPHCSPLTTDRLGRSPRLREHRRQVDLERRLVGVGVPFQDLAYDLGPERAVAIHEAAVMAARAALAAL